MDSAALDSSRRVLFPVGNCGDNFLIQKFSFPPLWLSGSWKMGLRFAGLAPKPQLCPSLWNNQQQSRHLMLKFCKLGFEWWRKWTAQPPQELEIAKKGNASSAFCRLEQEQQGKQEKTGFAQILDLPGACSSPHLQSPELQGFPGWVPVVPVEVRARRGCSSKPLDPEHWGAHCWPCSAPRWGGFAAQHHLPVSGYPENAHVSGDEFPAGSGMGNKALDGGQGSQTLPWGYLALWWAQTPRLGKKIII